MTRQRIKSTYIPLHPRRRHLITLDDSGFVYLGELKICRYVPEKHVLEFIDHRRTKSQPARIIEVSVSDFAGQIERLLD